LETRKPVAVMETPGGARASSAVLAFVLIVAISCGETNFERTKLVRQALGLGNSAAITTVILQNGVATSNIRFDYNAFTNENVPDGPPEGINIDKKIITRHEISQSVRSGTYVFAARLTFAGLPGETVFALSLKTKSGRRVTFNKTYDVVGVTLYGSNNKGILILYTGPDAVSLPMSQNLTTVAARVYSGKRKISKSTIEFVNGGEVFPWTKGVCPCSARVVTDLSEKCSIAFSETFSALSIRPPKFDRVPTSKTVFVRWPGLTTGIDDKLPPFATTFQVGRQSAKKDSRLTAFTWALLLLVLVLAFTFLLICACYLKKSFCLDRVSASSRETKISTAPDQTAAKLDDCTGPGSSSEDDTVDKTVRRPDRCNTIEDNGIEDNGIEDNGIEDNGIEDNSIESSCIRSSTICVVRNDGTETAAESAQYPSAIKAVEVGAECVSSVEFSRVSCSTCDHVEEDGSTYDAIATGGAGLNLTLQIAGVGEMQNDLGLMKAEDEIFKSDVRQISEFDASSSDWIVRLMREDSVLSAHEIEDSSRARNVGAMYLPAPAAGEL
jgi:hypothetical protein